MFSDIVHCKFQIEKNTGLRSTCQCLLVYNKGYHVLLYFHIRILYILIVKVLLKDAS
jgi:hypothetical protein